MTADDARFVDFVRAHGRSLARTATLIAGDPVAGEDLLQTALAQVYVRCKASDDIEDLERYVRVVLVRAQISWRRRLSSTELPAGIGFEETSAPDIADGLVDRRLLLAVLRKLPAKQRATLVLRFLDDLSEAETARIIGCSKGAVKQHTSRGLAKLRELLGAEVIAVDMSR